MDLPRPFERFIPAASTVYRAMNPTICAKIIPGVWGFFRLFCFKPDEW